MQRLLDQLCGDRLGLAALRHVDGLDERVGALLLVRLRESDDRPAERIGRAGVVVAVVAAEAGGRHEEGTGVVERAHRGVERLHPPAQRLAPTGEVVVGEVAVGVERGEPVDAGDRRFRVPLGQLRDQVVGGQTGLDGQGGGTRLVEQLDERITDAAFVEHHDDAGTVELDTGRETRGHGGAQRRNGDPPGKRVDGIEVTVHDGRRIGS